MPGDQRRGVVADLRWLQQPLLAFVERRQRAFELVARRLRQWRDLVVGCPRRADGQRLHGVPQLAAEGGVVVDFGLQNGERGGGALLAVVAKGRAHQVLDRLIVIGQRGDDQAVFAARFSEQLQARLPRLKQLRRLAAARQDHGIRALVRHQHLTDFVVRRGQKLEHLARDARRPEALRQLPADERRLGRGLEEDAVARHQRGQHAARRNRQREIPRRRHDDYAQRRHLDVGEDPILATRSR